MQFKRLPAIKPNIAMLFEKKFTKDKCAGEGAPHL